MPLDFPTSPTNGQAYNGYVYSTAVGAWQAKPSAQSPFYTGDTPPGNPVVGDSWFNTNDGTMYVYFNDGNTSQWVEHRSEIARSQVGLVPILPTSISVGSGTANVNPSGIVNFSAVTSISLNNVFSSTYANYQIQIYDLYGSLDSESPRLRWRSSGTDNSSSQYYTSGVTGQNSNGAVSGWGVGVNSFIDMGRYRISSSSWFAHTLNVYQPNISGKYTFMTSVGFWENSSSPYVHTLSNTVNNTAAYDGLTLFPANGNFTGKIKVYGYN